MSKELVNRVAQSSLITINLEKHFPSHEIVELDIANYLFQGLILREKEYRSHLKEKEWEEYSGKIVVVFCSTDAIIPVWAYMLIGQYLEGLAEQVFIGTKDEFLKHHYYTVLDEMDYEQYDESRVVIKGCSDKPVPAAAYAFLTEKLKPFAQSIMYGEPCSTVPIFKRPRKLPLRR